MIRFDLVRDDGWPSSVNAFMNGRAYTATADHPHFTSIVDALTSTPQASTDDVIALFDVSQPIAKEYNSLSERIKIANAIVYFDGVPVHNTLADLIVRFYQDKQKDLQPLVNFFEKIETNPNPHSREHLFRWLSTHNFAIMPDGDFVAYKGLDSQMRSINSGTAIVNNKTITGKIPNLVDTIIEMPRNEVEFNPAVGCSVGLHAGTYAFARGFTSSGKVMVVKINPRDVVSVPVDAGDAKLRVCRYRVLSVASGEVPNVLHLGRIPKTAAVDPEKVASAKIEPEQKQQQKKLARKPTDKPAAAPKAKEQDKPSRPPYYEQWAAAEFNTLSYADLRWLAKEWNVTGLGSNPSKDALVLALVKSAKAAWNQWSATDKCKYPRVKW